MGVGSLLMRPEVLRNSLKQIAPDLEWECSSKFVLGVASSSTAIRIRAVSRLNEKELGSIVLSNDVIEMVGAEAAAQHVLDQLHLRSTRN